MPSDLSANWPWIVSLFRKSIKTTGFFTFATVSPDGSSHATPIASLVLNNDCSGYFSDVYQGTMIRNLKTDQRICILAVRMGLWYWLKALVSARFEGWPGVRLYGSVGKRRKARPGEIDRWRNQLKTYRWTKGYKLLWKDVEDVRDIKFTHYEPVRIGPLTQHLMSPHQ